MNKFVFIFGPQAVGKMTVGEELAKMTDLKLFHNHMAIEMLEPLYGFTPEMWRLTSLIRNEIFDSFANSDAYGLIFTKVWNLSSEKECEGIERLFQRFESKGCDVCIVELEADTEERLQRNRSSHRLEQKPTKRNIEKSERDLLSTADSIRLNTEEGEITRPNYIRINNTHMSAEDVAKQVKEQFEL
ncbi:AAA family ATPase [Alkalibacillus haloalkaliphilus]|uniref:AAA family ATPase n=1 Tax=Alkalibacillus haloalkaliphilus TaxID=94136 RepID=UPI00293637C2|nr:AAA family ATPase [Alkalibacillus haloalkaliphilus]MDV2581389.1 AAA family ATPase [Alkalibacillus haloalkaliphilus]